MVSAVVVVRILKIFVVLFVVLGIVILVVSVFVLAVVMRFSMMLSSTTVAVLLAVDVIDDSQSAFIDGKLAEVQVVHVVTHGANRRVVNPVHARQL